MNSFSEESVQPYHAPDFQSQVDALLRKKHLPEQMVVLVSEVSKLQYKYLPKVNFGSDSSLPPNTLKRLAPPEKHHAGLPLLAGKDFPLDMHVAKELAKEILHTLPEALPHLKNEAAELDSMFDANARMLKDACREALKASTGRSFPLFNGWANNHPHAPNFLRFIATSAAMPSLLTASRILSEKTNTEKVWLHGHCPICGNLPLMGRLTKKEGIRMHSCSFCGFEYRAPRIGCPFCLVEESEGTEYYTCDEEPGYMLSFCKPCKNYFKLADRREYDRPWYPFLEDLSSLALDFYAIQQGFNRPTLSGWGF